MDKNLTKSLLADGWTYNKPYYERQTKDGSNIIIGPTTLSEYPGTVWVSTPKWSCWALQKSAQRVANTAAAEHGGFCTYTNGKTIGDFTCGVSTFRIALDDTGVYRDMPVGCWGGSDISKWPFAFNAGPTFKRELATWLTDKGYAVPLTDVKIYGTFTNDSGTEFALGWSLCNRLIYRPINAQRWTLFTHGGWTEAKTLRQVTALLEGALA